MTTFERFERSIPELMTELAPARVPDYVDDMLQQTAGVTQRPAWSYPERWLPVEITARPLSMRSFPWRPLLVLALVAGLIVAGVLAYVGSQNRVPPPFGVARNGVLMYRGSDGAIVSFDPTSGSQATVIPASDAPREPILSRDGRRVLLLEDTPRIRNLYVEGVDGSDRTTLAGDYRFISGLEWSPDGSTIAIIADDEGVASVTLAASDGSGATTLPLHRNVRDLRYLPDGRLALIAAEKPGEACPGNPVTDRCALFIVNGDGSGFEPLISNPKFHGLTIDPSVDGKSLLYVEWSAGAEGRLHVFDVDTHADHLVPTDGFPALYSMNRAFLSPDAKSILFDLMEVDGDHWAVVPVAGGPIVRLGKKFPDGADTEAKWSPDGKSVLARYATGDASELWLFDPTGSGADRKLDVNVPYLPEWQRLALVPWG